MVWAPHLDILCDEIQMVYERVFKREEKEYDLIINIPPGTTKSTICTIMAPAWSWAVDDSLRHITGSYSQDLSTEHAVKSRDIIKSDLFLKLFGNVELKKDEDNKTNYKTIRGGQRYATSVGGTVTGVHAHIITIDDPVNPKQASSEVQLNEANLFFDKTLPTRKVDKAITPIILIMQRLATQDPTGHILTKKKEKIRHVCLPAEISDSVRPIEYKSIYKDGLLDPIRLGRAVLEEAKTDLGSYNYAGQFSQSPAPEDGEVWQKWIIPIDDEKFPHKSLMQHYGTDWDTAFTSDEDNAANAYFTAGKIGEMIYIDDFDFKWLEFPELIRWMRTKPSPHYVEAKATGKSAKQTLVQMGVPAIEIKVPGGSDKVARARSVTPIAESGMVFIRKSLLDRLYNDDRQGILQFPKSKYKDVADALAQCLTRLKKRGTIISTTGEDTEQSDRRPPSNLDLLELL